MKRKIILSIIVVLILAVSSSAFDGEEKWHIKLDTPISSGIAVSENILLLGDMSGKFYALDKETGKELWSYYGTGTICGVPSVVFGQVVFAQADGEITCLNISDGSKVWSNSPGDYGAMLSDGTAYGDGRVFASRNDGKLYALSIKNGKELWTYTAKQALRTAPAYSEGIVFLGEYDGIFSMIDGETGNRLNGGEHSCNRRR